MCIRKYFLHQNHCVIDRLTLMILTAATIAALAALAVSASGFTNSLIGSGNGHACVLPGDGSVKCWGGNVDGQSGTGGDPNDDDFPGWTEPVTVAGIDGAVEVDTSSRSSCARVKSGRVFCWGANYEGELGDGTDQRRATPAEVKGVVGALQLRSGGDQTCVVRNDRGVSCWGPPKTQRTGRVRKTPVAIKGLKRVRELAVGFYGACAIVEKGRLKCWGDNAAGWKPVGGSKHRPSPVVTKGIVGAKSVALADYSTCAVIRSGRVKCWGAPMTVKFKDFDKTQDFSKPRIVDGVTGASQVIAGDYHACALLKNRTVKCWGDGSDGQLGNGRYANDQKPSRVRGLKDVRALTGGFTTTCAVLLNNAVKCWGSTLVPHTRKNSKSAVPVTVVP